MAKNLYIKLQSPVVELEVKTKDCSGKEESLLVGFKRYDIKVSEDKLKTFLSLIEKDESTSKEYLNGFIKGEVSYLKNVQLDIEEDGVVKPILVKDTRDVAFPDIWKTAEECLGGLLDLYLMSSPWRVPFITTLQKAMYNVDLDSLNIKN